MTADATLRAHWAADAELRAEFRGSFESFAAYQRAAAAGRMPGRAPIPWSPPTPAVTAAPATAAPKPAPPPAKPPVAPPVGRSADPDEPVIQGAPFGRHRAVHLRIPAVDRIVERDGRRARARRREAVLLVEEGRALRLIEGWRADRRGERPQTWAEAFDIRYWREE